jgi:hypothetical protein
VVAETIPRQSQPVYLEKKRKRKRKRKRKKQRRW